jgi:hypothetical protein
LLITNGNEENTGSYKIKSNEKEDSKRGGEFY